VTVAARRERRLSVLLVDDEPDILSALTLAIEDVADVRVAASVADALPLLETHHFDVVVADLRLPDRWGDELLAHVAAHAPTTRRLLLTGDTDPDRTVRELLDLEVIDACYRKPHVEGLVAVLREMVGMAEEA
jgi:DNA-binding NtrC family response regulator